jgi:multidrug resistance efflux pump
MNLWLTIINMTRDKAGVFYIFIGVLMVSMVYITYRFFNGSGRSTVGITYAKEYKINAEKAALIKAVHVVSGQQVKKGDILVELSSQQLEMDIDRLQNRIAVLKSEQTERAKLLNSEIAYAKAQHGIDIGSIDANIVDVQSKLKLNNQLAKEFTTEQNNTDHSQDPLQLKLNSLDDQKKMHQKALDIKVSDIIQESNTEQILLGNQIRLLEKELDLLFTEKKKLNKYATFDGVIGNVFVKSGEEVDAFYPLLSANPAHPTTVVGYFIGRNERALPISSPVTIMSYDHHIIKVTGKVIGFGSVVELPEILQKSTAVKAFGREIFIEIDTNNAFATGEKVLIK